MIKRLQQTFRGEGDLNIIGRMRLFLTVSSLAVVASIVLIAVAGLNYGIDFAGGYEIQVRFAASEGEVGGDLLPPDQLAKVNEAKLKELIEPVVGDAQVQRFGLEEDREFLILVREHGAVSEQTKDALRQAYSELAGGPDKLAGWSMAESGESMKVSFTTQVTEEQVRKVLEDQQLHVTGIIKSDRDDQPTYSVSLRSLADEIQIAVGQGLGIEESQWSRIVERVEFVGPQVGEQLRNQGIMAVLAALFFILLYVGIRFDLFFAPGAVIALTHDVCITIGVFALLQLEFNLPIIAAVLAIVGYSLNDTIVIYDRVRENVVRMRGRDLRSMVNASINQTLSRTLLTSVTTLLVVLALFVFGGGIIRTFSVALLVGITVGTYSSMAISTPVYILLKERYGGETKGARKSAAAKKPAA